MSHEHVLFEWLKGIGISFKVGFGWGFFADYVIWNLQWGFRFRHFEI